MKANYKIGAQSFMVKKEIKDYLEELFKRNEPHCCMSDADQDFLMALAPAYEKAKGVEGASRAFISHGRDWGRVTKDPHRRAVWFYHAHDGYEGYLGMKRLLEAIHVGYGMEADK